MKRIALALLLAAACTKRAPVAPKKAAAPPPAPVAAPNLLEMSRGASVVSRTAELDLLHSAIRLIDTAGGSGWVTPSNDPVQSAVLSLPARARIDHAGILTTRLASGARDVRFDFSLDGEHFTRSVTMTAAQQDNPQLVAVNPPVEAQYVRVSPLNGRGNYVFIRKAIVNGTFLAPPAAGAIDGCWSVNGQPATFRSDHALVFGHVGGADDTDLEGGSDGRFYRFAWTRDKEYGLAAMSVTPDGKHLASLVWHEQAIEGPAFYANDWLGDRAGKDCPKLDVNIFGTYLQRFGYFPLYALEFGDDGTLDDAASSPTLARVTSLLTANRQLRVAFVAHELTHASPGENLAVAQRKIATLREALLRRGVDLANVQLMAAGEEHPRRPATSALTRAMYSSVDLELRR